MTINLKDYQIDCCNEILEHINSGEKHIAISMATGFGKTVVALYLAKQFSNNNVLYLTGNTDAKNSILTKANRENVDITIESISNLYRKSDDRRISLSDFNFIIIDDICRINHFKNIQLIEYANDDAIILSFFTPSQEAFNSSGISTQSVYTVLPTGNIRTLNYTLNSLTKDKKLLRENVNKKIVKISAEMDKLRKENEQLKDKCSELDEKLHRAKQECQYLRQMLTFLGVDKKLIDNYIFKMAEKREELLPLLSSDNQSAEEAVRELQDYGSSILTEIVERNVSQSLCEQARNTLKDMFTENVWDRLSYDTQRFLLSAKVSFNSMLQMENPEELDFSGVCLLVTKAVELETKIRFFDKYKHYLKTTYPNLTEWPQVMVYVNSYGKSFPQTIFTLGTVKFVSEDKNGVVNNVFLDYAMKTLYRNNDKEYVKKQIIKSVDFVEIVRNDYRNPTAHTSTLDKVTAQNCIDYVVEVQKQLKFMLEKMTF